MRQLLAVSQSTERMDDALDAAREATNTIIAFVKANYSHETRFALNRL